MIPFDEIDSLADPILELYERYIQSVLNDIARRLAKMDMTSAAAWQMQRLIESGQTYDQALAELAKITGRSDTELRKLFEAAGVKSIQFDDMIYKRVGLKPLPLNLSPAMAQVLAAGLRKTQGVVRNLTMTTAIAAQNAFIDAADLAYLQVSSGAFDYISAIRNAVKEMTSKGLSVIQYSGRKDQLDVAVRRTVLTGVSQTVGNLQLARAQEMGCDLVAVSAHVGARNVGEGPANHESWQGKIYSISAHDTEYGNFVEVTGYGTVVGLHGINCRHSFYPFYKGISETAYTQAELDSYADKTVIYNGKEMSVYEATQYQRGIERKIRHWKRQEEALKAAELDTEYETGKVRQWQGEMRKFVKETELIRQREREQIVSIFPKTIHAQKSKRLDLYSEDNYSLGLSADLRSLYSSGDEVHPYLRSEDTQISSFLKIHIKKDHPERIDWITNHPNEIALTVQQPQIVEKTPWKRRNGHWSQTFIREFPELNGFSVVAVSLATLPGEIESEFHQVTSIFFTNKKKDFFDKDNNLKKRWLFVK